jgi:hypothetical protein
MALRPLAGQRWRLFLFKWQLLADLAVVEELLAECIGENNLGAMIMIARRDELVAVLGQTAPSPASTSSPGSARDRAAPSGSSDMQ